MNSLFSRWTQRKRHTGAAQTAPPPPAPAPTMDRKALIRSFIDVSGRGLEIGPSHNAITPKREGYKVEIVDHAGRAALVEKYRPHGVDVDSIEEVDHVWNGTSYSELTGHRKFYDWIIASHVIEHVPDMIGFLKDCDAVMRDGGVLSLAVPDKRYCFDRFRALTGVHSLIDAHMTGMQNHSPGRVADYFLNVVQLSGRIAWDANHALGKSIGEMGFVHGVEDAKSGIRAVAESNAYLDIHAWCFTPSSFRLLVEDLHQLGFSPLREAHFHSTAGGEFYMALSSDGAGPQVERFELLRRVDAEMAECAIPA